MIVRKFLASEAIAKGKGVKIVASAGAALAAVATTATDRIIGIAKSAIASGAYGYVVLEGRVQALVGSETVAADGALTDGATVNFGTAGTRRFGTVLAAKDSDNLAWSYLEAGTRNVTDDLTIADDLTIGGDFSSGATAADRAVVKGIYKSGTIAVTVPSITDPDIAKVDADTSAMTFACAVGDAVIAIPSEALPTNCRLQGAQVTAADTVQVTFGSEGGNVTGAAKNFTFLFFDLT